MAEAAETSPDNGLLAPLPAAPVFKLALSRTPALILSTRNNAPAPTTRDSTLNGLCGLAARLHAAVACKLDERLTAVAKTIMFRSDLATLLLAVTVNGESLSYIISILKSRRKPNRF